MKLLLFRHGIAEDESLDGTDDARRLTTEGVEKTAAVAAALARFVEPPKLILTSPKIRAVQTARIAAAAFDRPVETLDLLGDNDPNKIAHHVVDRPENSLMLVGHEPSFGAAAELLCHEAWEGYISLKKAGCICLELINDTHNGDCAAQLLWMTTPKMLLALRGGQT